MYLVGDADRDRGLALLRRHYAEGRLSVDELVDRVEAVARARTTTQLRAALRDLPLGVALGSIAPRAAVATPLVRGALRVALAAALLVAWTFASLALLVALGVTLLVAGASGAIVAGFTLAWGAATWLAWRVWRAVGTRPQARPD